jgi:hypothetical protein
MSVATRHKDMRCRSKQGEREKTDKGRPDPPLFFVIHSGVCSSGYRDSPPPFLPLRGGILLVLETAVMPSFRNC